MKILVPIVCLHAWRLMTNQATATDGALQGLHLLRDLLTIEVPLTLNAALCEFHRGGCPPSAELERECSRVSAGLGCMTAPNLRPRAELDMSGCMQLLTAVRVSCVNGQHIRTMVTCCLSSSAHASLYGSSQPGSRRSGAAALSAIRLGSSSHVTCSCKRSVSRDGFRPRGQTFEPTVTLS